MPTVLLVRHGETHANRSGVLAGRLPGVTLTSRGRDQATAAGRRIAQLSVTHFATSPLERTRETARIMKSAAGSSSAIRSQSGLIECDYGSWSGKRISTLAKQPLWTTVQHRPSHVVFPDGESMREMAQRAVAAVLKEHTRAEELAGPDAVWVAVTHGDVIKAIVADALGLHLDNFQRINADPGSITVITHGKAGAFVIATNTRAGDLTHLNRNAAQRTRGQVGGGRG